MRLATIKIDAAERLVACVDDEKLIDLKASQLKIWADLLIFL